ncbi:MAG: hypothetical protein V5A88_01560 [Candidatus Thermoplasmatota archaeon]
MNSIENSVELEVKKSTIDKKGRTRMSKKAFESLELQPGDEIVVSSKEKSITLAAFTDDLVEEGTIHLRKGDIERLGVEEKNKVLVSLHNPITEKVKKRIPWPKKDKQG